MKFWLLRANIVSSSFTADVEHGKVALVSKNGECAGVDYADS